MGERRGLAAHLTAILSFSELRTLNLRLAQLCYATASVLSLFFLPCSCGRPEITGLDTSSSLLVRQTRTCFCYVATSHPVAEQEDVDTARVLRCSAVGLTISKAFVLLV